MKLPTIILTALSFTAAAQPFVIVSTRVQHIIPTHVHERRQGLLDSLQSAVEDAFGISDDEETTVAPPTTTKVTLPTPVTAPIEDPESTISPNQSDDDEEDSSDSEDEEETTIVEPTRSTTSRTTARTTSETSTSETSIATPAPTPALGTATPTASAAANSSKDEDEDDNKGGVPAGGVAVAVIMVLLILSIAAILTFRYHPRCQAWWAQRQEKAQMERSYRDGIDGVGGLNSSPTLRQQALAGGVSRRRTMLQSFFAPATAKLNDTTEIRRKPVNWGEPSSASPKMPEPPMPERSYDYDSEKVPMSASAAPLGQIERYSYMPTHAPPSKPAPMPVPAPPPGLVEAPGSTPLPAFPPVPVARAPSTKSHAESVTALPAVANSRTLPARGLSYNNHAHSKPSPQIPVHSPVSPMSLFPQRDPVTPGGTRRNSVDRLQPISPLSTMQHTRESMMSIARAASGATLGPRSNPQRNEAPLPSIPDFPAVPSLVHAKRGSDGVFRLK